MKHRFHAALQIAQATLCVGCACSAGDTLQDDELLLRIWERSLSEDSNGRVFDPFRELSIPPSIEADALVAVLTAPGCGKERARELWQAHLGKGASDEVVDVLRRAKSLWAGGGAREEFLVANLWSLDVMFAIANARLLAAKGSGARDLEMAMTWLSDGCADGRLVLVEVGGKSEYVVKQGWMRRLTGLASRLAGRDEATVLQLLTRLRGEE